MAQDNGSSWGSSGIWWLILGTSTGTVTSAILYGAGSFLMGLTSSIKDIVFQYIAQRFDISEHTFVRLSNMTTLPRLLEQLGLRTFRYMWLHEANAAANDSVQYGYIRMPTKSYLGQCLAFSHISHYIWISSELDKLHMVGPSVSVNAFVRMSNIAATRAMTPAEITELKREFGMDDAITDVDAVFIRAERRLFIYFIALCASMFTIRNLVDYFVASGWRSLAVVVKCGVAFILVPFSLLGCLVWNANSRSNIASCICQPFRRMRSVRHRMDVLLEESSLMEMTIERRSDVSPAAVPMLAEEEPQHVEQDESISDMYSLVLSKSYYYTVAQQLQIVPSANIRPVILPADDVKFYAMSICCSFPNYVATLVDLNCGNLLYICIYNPMTDPPLSALRELLLSAQKEKPIFLVVILPSLDTLASALQRPSVMRLQTAHCTQFVSSICDFEDMLMKVSSGIISRLAFVIPVRDSDLQTLHANQVWNSATKILGFEHCIQAAVADRVSEYVV